MSNSVFSTVAAALVLAAPAAASPGKGVPPFEYRLQVTSVVLRATFTLGHAKAVTQLHLSAVPGPTSLVWYGRGSPFGGNGTTVTALHMTGAVTYSGLDPPCNGTYNVDSVRWRPVHADFVLFHTLDSGVTHPTLSADAGAFLVGTVYARRGGGCEKGLLRFSLNGYEADAATGDVPLPVLAQRGFTVWRHETVGYDGGSSLHWDFSMTVRKVRYLPIDCARTSYC